MCEAFIRNGMAMGKVSPERKDTGWFTYTNPRVYALVMNSLRYPALPEEERAVWQRRTHECVGEYALSQICGTGPFGWKLGRHAVHDADGAGCIPGRQSRASDSRRPGRHALSTERSDGFSLAVESAGGLRRPGRDHLAR